MTGLLDRMEPDDRARLEAKVASGMDIFEAFRRTLAEAAVAKHGRERRPSLTSVNEMLARYLTEQAKGGR